MDGNRKPSGSLYFELRFQNCPHAVALSLVPGADCKKHRFICMPELRERPFPSSEHEANPQGWGAQGGYAPENPVLAALCGFSVPTRRQAHEA